MGKWEYKNLQLKTVPSFGVAPHLTVVDCQDLQKVGAWTKSGDEYPESNEPTGSILPS
jgi:hypothetical protein